MFERHVIPSEPDLLTRAQFAVAVGATEQWVRNTASRIKFEFTREESRRLAFVYLFNKELGLSLATSGRLADEAMRVDVWNRHAVIQASGQRCTAVAVDLARFHSRYIASLSAALDLGGFRKRGRRLKDPYFRSKIVRAQEHGVNIGDLRVGVRSKNHFALRTKTDSLLKSLNGHRVKFVIAGGVAAMMRGSVQRHYSRADDEVDICYESSKSNVDLLAKILADWRPYPRWIERKYPFTMDERQFRETPHMVLATSMGFIDVSSEIKGIGDYKACYARSSDIDAFGTRFRVLEIDALIDSDTMITARVCLHSVQSIRDRRDPSFLQALRSVEYA